MISLLISIAEARSRMRRTRSTTALKQRSRNLCRPRRLLLDLLTYHQLLWVKVILAERTITVITSTMPELAPVLGAMGVGPELAEASWGATGLLFHRSGSEKWRRIPGAHGLGLLRDFLGRCTSIGLAQAAGIQQPVAIGTAPSFGVHG